MDNDATEWTDPVDTAWVDNATELRKRESLSSPLRSTAMHFMNITYRVNQYGEGCVNPIILKNALESCQSFESTFITGKTHRLNRDFVIIKVLEEILPLFKKFRSSKLSYSSLRESIIRRLPYKLPPFSSMTSTQIIELLDQHLTLLDSDSLHEVMNDGHGTNERINGPIEAAYFLVGKLFGVTKSHVAKLQKRKNTEDFEFYSGFDLSLEQEWRKFTLKDLYQLSNEQAAMFHEKLKALEETKISRELHIALERYQEMKIDEATLLDKDNLPDA